MYNSHMNLKKIIKENKNNLYLFLFLLIIYILTRLIGIMSLPMFTDEAIYTRWAQIAHNDWDWIFISLTDGKQPLFIWADLLIMYFVTDPLLAGRLVSVIAGFISMLGLYFAGDEIFKNKKVGLTASALYVLFPFALVYDRMALYDSMVTLFFIWGLFFTVRLIRGLSLVNAALLGITAGLGALNKTSGFLTIYLLPLGLSLFDFAKKGWREKVMKFFLYAALAAGVMYTMYNALRVSPFFYIISQKNDTFIYPISEWLTHPFTYLLSNFNSVSNWTITYVSIPIFIIALSAFFVRRTFIKEKIYLLITFLALLSIPIIFGRVIFPRYLFFMTIPVVLLTSYAVVEWSLRLKNRYLLGIAAIMIFLPWIHADYKILTDFPRSPIPEADRNQYANMWPSGGGYRELVSFVEEKSKKQKIFVATEGTFGSLPTYTIEIYHGENKNVEKKGFYPIPKDIPQELLEKAEDMPVYFVFNETQNPPETTWPIHLIEKYQKGVGDHYMRLYEVIPSNE